MKNKCISEHPFSPEWDFEKNSEVKATDVTAGSSRMICGNVQSVDMSGGPR